MGNLGTRVAPILQVAKVPIGMVATTLIRFIRPFGGPAADLYGLVSPPADRALLARPEIKAMFLDDLLNGSRRQMAAPFYDVIAFARDWGFRLDEVKVHVRWWHGDADHIVPLRARSARGVEAPRCRAVPHAGREPPRWARPRRGDPALDARDVGHRAAPS